jgi:uncharacterized protein
MGNPIKILSMDGGNGMNTGDLLTRVEKLVKTDFLNKADIFVGTSAGGINSLFFAKYDNPADALVDIKSFWLDVNMSILGGVQADEGVRGAHVEFQNTLSARLKAGQRLEDISGQIVKDILGLGCVVAGFRSLFLNDILKQFLTQYFKGFPTLADLKKNVVICTFKLDNGDVGSERSWVPRLYTNLPHNPDKLVNSAEEQLNLVDVAMRTAAPPVGLPIYQSSDGKGSGYVDGALVANNPGMIALAAIVGTLAQGVPPNIPPTPPTESLSDIYLLSVGSGRNLIGSAQYLAPEFTNGSAAWGYHQWLLDPTNLMVLIDAFYQGGNESVAWQCDHLLGPKNFHRLNVPLVHMLVPDDPLTTENVEQTAKWIESTPWSDPPKPKTGAKMMMALRPGRSRRL